MPHEVALGFLEHAEDVLTTGRLGPPTIGAGAALPLGYCAARLTYDNHYDVISL